jgi:hypothetical protein
MSLFSSIARSFLPTAAVFVLCVPFAAPAHAAQNPAPAEPRINDPRINHVLGELEKVRGLEQTALSPDGGSLAWVVDGEHGGSEIEVAAFSRPEKTPRVTAGDIG